MDLQNVKAAAFRRVFLASLLGLALGAGTARAQSSDVAAGLGSIVAAEKLCGLEYDQAAIAEYVRKHVPENDMDFAKSLSAYAHIYQTSQEGFSASEKTAFCEQTRRVAKSYGFTK